MNEPFEAVGGATVGWTNVSWPLAKLTATASSLRVRALFLGEYNFTPETVVAVTPYTVVPIVGWGVRVEHTIVDYPARCIFWSLGSPEKLLSGIRNSGFRPEAPITGLPARRGFALRWQVIVAAIAVWNLLFMTDLLLRRPNPPTPGPLILLAIGLALAATVATLRSPAFQRLVIKPGRSVSELRPFLNGIMVLLGIAFGVVLLLVLFG